MKAAQNEDLENNPEDTSLTSEPENKILAELTVMEHRIQVCNYQFLEYEYDLRGPEKKDFVKLPSMNVKVMLK